MALFIFPDNSTIEILFLHIGFGRFIRMYYYVRKDIVLWIWTNSKTAIKGPNKRALPKSSPPLSNENTGKIFKISFLKKLWKWTRASQVFNEYLLQIHCWISKKQHCLWCFSLPYCYPQLPISVRTLKDNSVTKISILATTVRKRNKLEFHKTYFLIIVTIWHVW